jgi:hypothetical protein
VAEGGERRIQPSCGYTQNMLYQKDASRSVPFSTTWHVRMLVDTCSGHENEFTVTS